jgi:hypothetical protein
MAKRAAAVVGNLLSGMLAFNATASSGATSRSSVALGEVGRGSGTDSLALGAVSVVGMAALTPAIATAPAQQIKPTTAISRGRERQCQGGVGGKAMLMGIRVYSSIRVSFN